MTFFSGIWGVNEKPNSEIARPCEKCPGGQQDGGRVSSEEGNVMQRGW